MKNASEHIDQNAQSPLAILLAAEERNAELCHENYGFLSRSNGFMPKQEPVHSLPNSFLVWEEIRKKTPELIRDGKLRLTFKKMPVLFPTKETLDDKYVLRASVMLGFFAHAYVNVELPLLTQDDLPSSIKEPWSIIAKRLHKPEPYLSYFDLIAYNWQFQKEAEQKISLENMDLLYPIFNIQEEQVLYLTQTEMMANASPMVAAVAQAQEAVLNDKPNDLHQYFDIIIECLDKITNTSFAKLSYNLNKPTGMDPVVFTKTMMSFAVPIKKGMPGPSGTAFPYVHLLDVFIGRKKYNTKLSQEALNIRALYPPNVKKFLEAVSKISVKEYIDRVGSQELADKYLKILAGYTGENGFLNVHRKRVYGFIQTSFKVGRPQTIGGFDGKNNESEWLTVDKTLNAIRKERTGTETATESNSKLENNKKTSKQNNSFSLSEIVNFRLNKEGVRLIINENVIELTRYLNKHPGGPTAILEFSGTNATKEFKHFHTSAASKRVLEALSIGKLEEPIIKEEKHKELWQLQKSFLFKALELYNIFEIEIDIAKKKFFPNENLNLQNTYKRNVLLNSAERFTNSYLVELLNSYSQLSEWLAKEFGDRLTVARDVLDLDANRNSNTQTDSELSSLKNLINLLVEAVQLFEIQKENLVLDTELVKIHTKIKIALLSL
jgi:cytochrome b involved in lipid metabolism